MITFLRPIAIICCTGLFAAGASAQTTGPTPAPMPAEIAAPRDMAYPGSIRLEVDATDTVRHIFNVRETVPVRGGERITLLYPKWLPGNHSPTGRIDALSGLMIKANGTRLEWTRDPVDVFAFHVDVPAGATSLDLEFQFLSAVESAQGRVVMTQEMMNLQWNAVTLYPAGYFTRQIPVAASVKLPEGWRVAAALDVASTAGGVTTFKPTSFEDLVDSPIFAGRHFKTLDLGNTGAAPVRLNIVADRPELLEMKPEHEEAHRAMVRQAYKLFGSHHYEHYDFLLALTDRMGGIGLEHHQSSENGTVPEYFTEWDKNAAARDLLPHEYTHSWNGKFRRPADLWTPSYNVPMRDSLLWVYEGQTQYWGIVLAARSGLLTKQQALDSFAATAATYDNRIGRAWKSLQDTNNDPVTAMRRSIPWRSWQRSEDYYSEGQLIWFDADTLIRELSRGRKSLDDFASAFFGINNGSRVPATYTFEDVVATLNSVQAHDWAAFLRGRLDGHGPGAPLDGLARSGYKLVYTDTPTDLLKSAETSSRSLGLTYSLGMVIGREAKLADVLWEGPAYKLGLTPGTQIIAVNGTAYSDDRIKEAITAAKKSGAPIEVLVKNGDVYRSVRFDYRDGLRYPRLERIAGTPDRFEMILSARK
ncbi:MAG: M61 family peptidase [Rhodospirillaceae bacterium]|nr:M61 family peptidase [Rhodospirillaceae bacterium]